MHPYFATSKVKSDPLTGFQCRRVIVFSVLIFAAVNMVGFLSGLTMARWHIYGATMEAAVVNARLLRRIAYGIVAALLYWRMVAPLASRRWLHVLIAFAGVQLLDMGLSLMLFHQHVSDLIELDSLGRAALAALGGWALARLCSIGSD